MNHTLLEIVVVATALAMLMSTLIGLLHGHYCARLRKVCTLWPLESAQLFTIFQMLLYSILLAGVLFGAVSLPEIEAQGGMERIVRLILAFVGLSVNAWIFAQLLYWLPLVSQQRWKVYVALPGSGLHVYLWAAVVWGAFGVS